MAKVLNEGLMMGHYTQTQTGAHTHTHIYIYVCVCMLLAVLMKEKGICFYMYDICVSLCSNHSRYNF
jgi:hypothetical protein